MGLASYLVGVDVGTGSARAALVTAAGEPVKVAVRDIHTWTPQPGFFEQSSDDIWATVCHVVREVTTALPSGSNVVGIGFDATCSLVAVDTQGDPVSVSPTGKPAQNVVLWMDHRAGKEAEEITARNHRVLRSVGGRISLEMETPKLIWLKRNLPESWKKADRFFDLPDFLTWRATGADSRSLCSLVCKWTYEAGPEGDAGWSRSYFEQAGLEELAADNWRAIGSKVLPPGSAVGAGLSPEAAAALGLKPGTPVAASMIDAHAGALGMLGCAVPGVSSELDSRLVLVSGTSTCHLAVSATRLEAPGVWGPYFGAVVPDAWAMEGGQSATGKLLEHITHSHPAAAAVRAKLQHGTHIAQYLHTVLKAMAAKKGLPSVSYLTAELHVWPDFHGNRSPLADASLLGMISGLSLSSDEESLALLYLATVQALAYGTRHIVETLCGSGLRPPSALLVCGGLSRDELFLSAQADALGTPLVRAHRADSVLLGAAMLAACAAGLYSSVAKAAQAMGGTGDVTQPSAQEKGYHDKKYRVFLKMVEDQREYKAIMSEK